MKGGKRQIRAGSSPTEGAFTVHTYRRRKLSRYAQLDLVWFGSAHLDSIRLGSVRLGSARFNSDWFGSTQFVSVRLDSAWFGSVQFY
ncbi:hypothetical protein BHM03_00001348 [Ensete ventricosum]|uniref:Uncharacterized protein n=1 Tax=Ensete ventricosum TaxID=4639 RepID=A0A445M959_ENSVE|nr:hypothetical protein BHM03_00001348 [Ensete ventricosum]